MIPRLGDGNSTWCIKNHQHISRLENDSPSRGRKLALQSANVVNALSLENDSPSRGRKLYVPRYYLIFPLISLENDSPSRGRKHILSWCSIIAVS